jgi:hypothetical protein
MYSTILARVPLLAFAFSPETWMSLLLGAVVTLIIAFIIYRIQKKETMLHKQDHDAKLEEIKFLHQQDSEKIKALYDLIIQSQRGSIGEIDTAILEQKIEVAADQITEQDSDHAQALKAIAGKQKDEADDLLDKISQREHDLAEVYTLRAINEKRNGNYPEHLTWRSKILELTPDDTEAQVNYMYALIETGQGQEAREMALARIKVLEQEGIPNDRLVYNLLNVVIMSYDYTASVNEQDVELVKPYIFRALELAKKNYGEHSEEAGTMYNHLGLLHRFKRQFKESEEYYLKAVAANSADQKNDESDLYASLYNLAVLYNLTGRYGEALPLLERARDIIVKTLGEEHPMKIYVLYNLASVILNLGKNCEALDLFVQTRNLAAKKLGIGSKEYEKSSSQLAMLYMNLERYAEAEEILKEKLKMESTHKGNESYDVAETLRMLAVNHIRQGKLDEAEKCLSKAIDILSRVAPPDDIQMLYARTTLANLNMKKGRDEEGLAELLALEKIRLGQGDDKSMDLAMLHFYLGQAYLKMKRWAEAELQISLAVRFYAEHSPRHQLYIKNLQLYAEILEHLGRQAEANEYKTTAEDLTAKLEAGKQQFPAEHKE